MTPEDLCIFLTSYTLTVAFASVAETIRRRESTWLITVVVALVAVLATTVVGFYVKPGESYLAIIRLLIRERDLSAIVSMAMGVAAALVWIVQLTGWSHVSDGGVRHSLRRRCVQQFLLAASIFGVVLGGQAFIWTNLLGVKRDPAARMLVPGFVIEKIADLKYPPVRIASSDDGKVYVSYDYFEAWGDMGGAIIELSPDPTTGKFREKIVADSTLLMRSYGLAARNGDLFVSRSGIFPRASLGKVSYESTGAVTQLKDLDGDGYFEFADDLVSGLPGVRGPDTMQQNNGIAFAADGSLFVTNGCSSNRGLDEHPWGGVVLRVSPDFADTEIFAEGFRNPFGIAIGPDDERFVTDNDIDENPGDELNHVVRGAHYGHPYVVPNEDAVESTGFRDPILVGELESNYQGMAYATSQSLPEEYRNCLYVTDYMGYNIVRLTLARDGDTYRVTGIHPFVSMVTPLDITVTPTGEFFVLSRRTQNVYRIRPRRATAESSHE